MNSLFNHSIRVVWDTFITVLNHLNHAVDFQQQLNLLIYPAS